MSKTKNKREEEFKREWFKINLLNALEKINKKKTLEVFN